MHEHLYGKFVEMNDRTNSVHIWTQELAWQNHITGQWTPIEIDQKAYAKNK